MELFNCTKNVKFNLYHILKENVSLQSVIINNKEQSPQVNVSNSVGNEWENFTLK